MIKQVNPSDAVSQAVSSLEAARFKLEGEKRGLQATLALKASKALDSFISALQKMARDLKGAGL